ncbi:MAG: HAD hydrolase family protein, partial [Clostridia bacterium]|nr:HAD hydrolase family protein [Clostridia bacterium]
DIGMLQMCGSGVAMANAIPEVKRVAKAFADTNDNDGVAQYLAENFLTEE